MYSADCRVRFDLLLFILGRSCCSSNSSKKNQQNTGGYNRHTGVSFPFLHDGMFVHVGKKQASFWSGMLQDSSRGGALLELRAYI